MSDELDILGIDYAVILMNLASIVPDRWTQDRLKTEIVTLRPHDRNDIVTTLLRALALLTYADHRRIDRLDDMLRAGGHPDTTMDASRFRALWERNQQKDAEDRRRDDDNHRLRLGLEQETERGKRRDELIMLLQDKLEARP